MLPGATVFAMTLLPAVLWAGSFSTSHLPAGQVGDKPSIIFAPFTITQSNSMTLVSGTAIACGDGFSTLNNNWLRRFDLNGAYGITTAFTVSSVDYGVEEAIGSAGGSQPLTMNLYSIPNAAPLLYSNLTLIGTASFMVADQTMTNLNQAVSGTVLDPNSSDLVVEISSPATGSIFFPGANDLGETAPNYIASGDCGVSDPIPTAAVGFPNSNLVMAVHGDTPVPASARTWAHLKATYR